MGILNTTPDSFSDGGRHNTRDAALGRAREMVEQGAHIVDIGGESTRPGSESVAVQQELDRVMPVVEAVHRELSVRISVDTSKPEVMCEAVFAGATFINDVKALRAEGALAAACELDVPVCLMHMQGEPPTMQDAPHYDDVVGEVRDFLLDRVRVCERAGIHRDKLILDPGFGFGKRLAHNQRLLAELGTLVTEGFPVLVGLSRKSMISRIVDRPVDERLYGSVALAVIAASKGASIVRVHDVAPTADAMKIVEAVLG